MYINPSVYAYADGSRHATLQHGELKDVDNWENVPLQGKSIQEIMNMTEYEETTTPTHMAPAAEEAGATSAVEEREASREHYGAEAGAGKQEMGAEGPTVLGTTTVCSGLAEICERMAKGSSWLVPLETLLAATPDLRRFGLYRVRPGVQRGPWCSA